MTCGVDRCKSTIPTNSYYLLILSKCCIPLENKVIVMNPLPPPPPLSPILIAKNN